jgi:uroporphyrin-III C-methyltransferase/precorrin-2 dehydrogenase/sirohydrochlorin ferrochelatase
MEENSSSAGTPPMRFLPVFLDLQARPVALIGAGAAALNKLRLLHSAGARVVWFAGADDVAQDALEIGANGGVVEVSAADPLCGDATVFAAVVSASGARDEAIAAWARAANIPVNVVDRPDLSTFIFPAVVDRGDVVVAIGTGGASPVLARRLREQIEALVPARIGQLAGLMKRYRGPFAAARHAGISTRRFWERVVDGPVGRLMLAGRWREADEALAEAVAKLADARMEEEAGSVSLVGAGPGDPDLLTLRALHALQNADVILYDDLVSPQTLDRARRDAERIFVGKRRGEPGIRQDTINELLIAHARRGKHVVRLKGGDPFIFGRGGEELEALREAGIAVSIVPGVTAAFGCAAEAGLPLTFRNEATRVSFVTAHRTADETTDWSAFSDSQTTLVVYMGLASAMSVRDGLIAAGRDPQTPASVIVRGTLPDVRTAVGRLDELPNLVAQAGEGPGLLVIGDVVAHSDAWRADTREGAAA